MKKRLHDKKAGIAILISIILISLAELIFRATLGLEAVLTTSNLGEQLAVILLAVTVLILTAKGKDRACYILYGAWIAYFVLDQLFELPGAILDLIAPTQAPTEEIFLAANIGHVIHIIAMCGIIALGIFLVEYMNDGTICNRAFNTVCIITVLLLVCNTVSACIAGIFTGQTELLLMTFHSLYRITMVFLFTFFAYDSAKAQLKKTDLTK